MARTADMKKIKSCPVVLSSPDTSVTHDSPSPHRMNEGYKARGALESVLNTKGLGIIVCCLFSLALIAGTSPQKSISARREQVPLSMAIGNGELMHECFPKHLRMGTAR